MVNSSQADFVPFSPKSGEPSTVDGYSPPEGTGSVSHEINRLGGPQMSYADALAGRPTSDVESQSNGERKPLLQKKRKDKSKSRGGGAQMRRSTTNESVSCQAQISRLAF